MIRIEQLIYRSARHFPNEIAVRDVHRDVTWAAFLAESQAMAARLVALGVGPGDRVAIIAHNRVEYFGLYFSCAIISAVLVPINTRLLPAEMTMLVARSKARVVVCDDRFVGHLAERPASCRGVTLDAAHEAGSAWTRLADVVPAAPSAMPAPSHDVSAVAVQMYTSGTTGLPKGAMLSHGNITSMAMSWLMDLTVRSPADRFLQVTPLFHVGATLMVMSCAAVGARVVLHDFAPAVVARALAEDGVTHTLMVPAMIRYLLDALGPSDKAFPALRMMAYGAAPISVNDLERAMRRFGCDFLQGYGLTETAGVLTSLRPEDHALDGSDASRARLVSAGRATVGVEIRVVSPDGKDVPAGELGEVVARGPNVFIGYVDMPEETEIAFRGGWFWTGDLGTMDELGYVTILDRSKDMLIVGGENVYPKEVEDALRSHPLVSDIAVIGVPSDRWGETVLAFVVPTSEVTDADDATRSIVWHARERLAQFKCPQRVEFVKEIPRNAAGKTLKAQLREPYWQGRERRV